MLKAEVFTALVFSVHPPVHTVSTLRLALQDRGYLFNHIVQSLLSYGAIYPQGHLGRGMLHRLVQNYRAFPCVIRCQSSWGSSACGSLVARAADARLSASRRAMQW
jgi:hypothetical protein